MELATSISKKAPSVLKGIYTGHRATICSHPSDSFFREHLAYFSKTEC